ncbi:MAG: DUF1501 domain-containing protein [bacterium]|nr:DUF1501 domain-containing protein [bacterium]
MQRKQYKDSRNIARRDFLKLAGATLGGLGGLSLFGPRPLFAQTTAQGTIDSVRYARPGVMPTVINVFLYGGASELGANFTNRSDIFSASVNSYPGGQVSVTANGFWEQAGGAIMEDLVSSRRMSVYRTIHRRKDNSRAHGRSISQNLKGGLNPEGPGIAANLAAILHRNGVVDPGNDLFPFVSLEGDGEIFDTSDLQLTSGLRPVALDGRNLSNPYEQRANGNLSSANSARLEDLANTVTAHHVQTRPTYTDLQRTAEFFQRRRSVSNFITNLRTLPLPGGVTYPANNPMADRLRSAMQIAVNNPTTRFISVGNGGIGGWDAHSDAINTYTTNMTRVMEALRAASDHMRATGTENRIVINVYGDFGRNVNLNNSRGWDHGNNQNLLTLGGTAYRRLGRVEGRTTLTGSAARNRLFTVPASGSVEYEPFAIASTVYQMFGVRNPDILTGENPIA